MYYKGTTMDENTKYLTEELQSAKEEKMRTWKSRFIRLKLRQS